VPPLLDPPLHAFGCESSSPTVSPSAGHRSGMVGGLLMQGWSRVGLDARRCSPAAAPLASAQLVPHVLMPPWHTLSPPRALAPYSPSHSPTPHLRRKPDPEARWGPKHTTDKVDPARAVRHHALSLRTPQPRHTPASARPGHSTRVGCTGVKSPCSSPLQSRGCSPLLVPRLTQLAQCE